MIVLFFFGGELERRVGSGKYLEIFLISGIVGNLGYIAFCYATHSFYPALGASGAIYGVMAALAIIAPEIKVLLFFFIPLSIRVALLLFILYNLLSMPFSSATGIAYSAHLALKNPLHTSGLCQTCRRKRALLCTASTENTSRLA